MSRLVSFLVLVAVVLFAGIMFYKVMIGFLLPLFFALLLVVMFSPLHQWILKKCEGRDRLAAALATAAILAIVMLPMLAILYNATLEGIELASKWKNTPSGDADIHEFIEETLTDLTEQFNLPVPKDDNGDYAIGKYVDTMLEQGQEMAQSLLLNFFKFAGAFLGGLFIMVIAIYYFLLDGPAMIQTLMRLSPIDDRHEQKMFDQFADVSRSVVIATLLSAFIQGVLAGVAYAIVGLDSIFLLTALTMLFALVPFVGAAAVWVPCCLWLYFGAGETTYAIGLAIYCATFVSMSDNVVKPWVLSGRANMHPLLALLSVLGGVTALGPIGILVGPMIVAFIQPLMNMLHTEMLTLDASGRNRSVASSQSTPAPLYRIRRMFSSRQFGP